MNETTHEAANLFALTKSFSKPNEDNELYPSNPLLFE
jgi:hypothetical protein